MKPSAMGLYRNQAHEWFLSPCTSPYPLNVDPIPIKPTALGFTMDITFITFISPTYSQSPHEHGTCNP